MNITSKKTSDDQVILSWLLVCCGAASILISVFVGVLIIRSLSKKQEELGPSQLLNRLAVEQAATLITEQTLQIEIQPQTASNSAAVDSD